MYLGDAEKESEGLGEERMKISCFGLYLSHMCEIIGFLGCKKRLKLQDRAAVG